MGCKRKMTYILATLALKNKIKGEGLKTINTEHHKCEIVKFFQSNVVGSQQNCKRNIYCQKEDVAHSKPQCVHSPICGFRFPDLPFIVGSLRKLACIIRSRFTGISISPRVSSRKYTCSESSGTPRQFDQQGEVSNSHQYRHL